MKISLIKQGTILYPYGEEDIKKLEKFSNAIYEVDMKNLDTRTAAQNRALHMWCDRIATLLNTKGLFMKGVFGNNIEWTMELVKTQIIKATIKQVFGVNSTTKLKRKEIDQLIDFVTIAFAKKGIAIPPFPSKELWEDSNGTGR